MDRKELEFVTNTNPPRRILNQLQFYRIGNIFFKLAMTCFVLSGLFLLLEVLVPLIYGVAYVLIILIAIIAIFYIVVYSVGTVLLLELDGKVGPIEKIWNFIEKLANNGDAAGPINMVILFCAAAFKAASVIGAASCVISIVFVALSKSKLKVLKFVFLGIALVSMVGLLVVYYMIGGPEWQF